MATRYPAAGKGGKWTVRELNEIPVDWKGDTLNDGGGLRGQVRVNSKTRKVSVRFQYSYRWDGKTRFHQCGTYPGKNIKKIRAERDRAKQLVADGINPTDQKKAARIDEQNAIEATIREE